MAAEPQPQSEESKGGPPERVTLQDAQQALKDGLVQVVDGAPPTAENTRTPAAKQEMHRFSLEELPSADGFSAETAWGSVPTGGEGSWSSSNLRARRLKVAELQKALTTAVAGIYAAIAAVESNPDQDQKALVEAGFEILKEAEGEQDVEEEEWRRLRKERKELRKKVKELRKDAAQEERLLNTVQLKHQRMQAVAPKAKEAPLPPGAAAAALLVCLKDVARANQDKVLNSSTAVDPKHMQVVQTFLASYQEAVTAAGPDQSF